jgi:hypothetical protein
LIARVAFIVLLWRQEFPDDPVPVAPTVDGEAPFPFPFKGIAEIRCLLQVVEQPAASLDLPVRLSVMPVQSAQIRPGFGGEGYFVSLCRG